MVTAAGKVVRVDGANDPELFWGMRGNGASFGIVTEFVVRLRDMPNHGIIRSAPILWAADKAKDVMTSWMGRIGRHDRQDTETLQFVFMHSPDGHPVCGVVPLIVGENGVAAKAACDELAAFGGGALVRQDTQLPYTALQAALDKRFPFNANYWDKGVVIDWDRRDPSAVNSIVDAAVKHWGEKPEFASKLSTILVFMEVSGAVGRADPASSSFAARNGRLWCTSCRLARRRRLKTSGNEEVVRRFRNGAEPLSSDHVFEQRHARKRHGNAGRVPTRYHEAIAGAEGGARSRQPLQGWCMAV